MSDATAEDAATAGAPAASKPAASAATDSTVLPADKDDADIGDEDKKEEKKAEDYGPPPEERVPRAEALKEDGNTFLKAGQLTEALAKYMEGIALAEPLLEKNAADIGEELHQRGVAAYIALRLNSAQACIKSSDWVQAAEQAEKVLVLDKDNVKALYRRGLASLQLSSESRLEQSRADFTRLATLEPSNKEARQQLSKAKEKLKEIKGAEKQRLSMAMTGGLYKEQHDKLGKMRTMYDAEVVRRKEAEESEITFEEFLKKQKEKEEDGKKKDKEEKEKQMKKENEQRVQERYAADMAKRKEAGEVENTFEEWEQEQIALEEERKRTQIGGVMKTDDADLDDDERKLLQETKSKGYYHGRLGTVLSDAAPKPKQVDSGAAAEMSGVLSEWNQAGTWEEKDMTSWAKERLSAMLGEAVVPAEQVTLPSGKTATATAKVTKVKSLNGDAQMVMVRKQAKPGFNFDANLSFSISFDVPDGQEGGSQTLSGSFRLPELMDCVSSTELRIEAKWKGSPPGVDIAAKATEWLDRLRTSVRARVVAFKEEYAQKR